MKKIEIEDKDFDVIRSIQSTYGYEMVSTAITKLVDEYSMTNEIRQDYDQMAELINKRRLHRDQIRKQNEAKRTQRQT